MTQDQFFEHISNQFQDNLPFVAYRKPNTSMLKGMLQENREIHIASDFTESGFIFAPFDADKDAILIPLNSSKVIESEFVINDNIQKSKTTNEINASQKEFHINLVQKGIAAINDQQLKKVVLSRCEDVSISDADPIALFEKLLNTYNTAFVYVWYHPKVGLWLGATPETLLRVRGSELKTMALAGTQAFQGTTEVNWKEKEKEEQQIVTDFIVENLRKSIGIQDISTDAIKVSNQKTVKAGNLLHLQTEIAMHLKPEARDLKQILNNLHPTPAVCGFPKENAKAFILENEGYKREFYAGFIGELNLKETIRRNMNKRNVENNAYNASKTVSNLYVNLRCMQIKQKKILIYVGGGITKDSVPEMEWEETVHKSQIIKSVI